MKSDSRSLDRAIFIFRIALIFHFDRSLMFHPNAVRFSAKDASGNIVLDRTYDSVGGGFVVSDEEANRTDVSSNATTCFPFPFTNGENLMAMCLESGMRIDEIVDANERTMRSCDEIESGCDQIWKVMQESIQRGCETKVCFLVDSM